MSRETEISPLIQTKLHRPRVANDLVTRTRLLVYLDTHRARPFTLISAPAGYGKTTLLAQWLEQTPFPAAWLSLDERDNHPIDFLSYLVAAIRTLFPDGCPTTKSLLTVSQIPPLDYLTTTLINEIAELPEQFLLVLDDYHMVDHKDIHQLVSALIKHAPPSLHLVIASRKDPPFSISRSRATRKMAEIRMNDLRFTSDEVRSFLKTCLGARVSPEIVTLLVERTEGWAVGLRLACMSLREQDDRAAFLKTFQGTDQYIMEYLVDEILSRQPLPTQTFLLYTSFLDRFCAPLGDALLAALPSELADGTVQQPSVEILARLTRENLFLMPLDQQGEWFRYHHLFQDLLWHKLKAETTSAQRAALRIAASRWLDENGFAEEALRHYFAAKDTAAAAQLVARQRYALLNRTRWQQLDQRLRQFSPAVLDQYPDLLMLKTWLLYHRGQLAELPAALHRLEAVVAQATLTPEKLGHLQGEISALRSHLYYHSADPENSLIHARQAIEKTPRQLWIVRILARLHLAAALQMMGDANQAYAAIYQGFEEEEIQSDRFKATLVMSICNIHWIDADLTGMARAARQSITLGQDVVSPEILNYSYFHLGRVCYQQNDLAAAEQHFAAVVQQPYLNYGDCYAHSACGLAQTRQVQGRPDEASAVIEAATEFMMQTGNTTLLPLIQAFRAEIALGQGQQTVASQWAAILDPVPPFQPVYGFFSPHLTLVKVWLAQDTPASRSRAANLLETAKLFFETSHNSRFLIDVLVLQALLNNTQGQQQAALTLLAQALTLAQPGGFIRLFVDFGPQLADLLAELKPQDNDLQQYVGQILAACAADEGTGRQTGKNNTQPSAGSPQPLIEPLTYREQDVLGLLVLRLSDQEIANRLVISLPTVKTHNRNIFAKLNVNNRRQAIARARQLGLISSE